MIGYENRRNEGVNPENRAAQLEFTMSEQLAEAVVPLLMPSRVYERMAEEGQLLLETPPIKPLPGEAPGLPASDAVEQRLPLNWQNPDSKFVVQGITQGRHSRYKRTSLFAGVSWLFHLQKHDAFVLGKVAHGAARPIRPQPLRLGVLLHQRYNSKRDDRTLMLQQPVLDVMQNVAYRKLLELQDGAYILGNPAIVDRLPGDANGLPRRSIRQSPR